MKILNRRITAEDELGEDVITVDDMLSEVKDNFNYVLDGIDLLNRQAKEDIAMVIATELRDNVNKYVAELASYLTEGE